MQKVNKSSGAHFRRFLSRISYFLMFLSIQIDLIISKTDDEQFTLTTKKSLNITFEEDVVHHDDNVAADVHAGLRLCC